MNTKWIFYSLVLILSANDAFADLAKYKLPQNLSNVVLAGIYIDGQKPHEALPLGPPSSYDWAVGPKVGKWNSPPFGFLAATGWGQAFYIKNGAIQRPVSLHIRNFQTFICTITSQGEEWTSTQNGKLEGRQFHADFRDNANSIPSKLLQTDAELDVSFEVGKAFHFWPLSGRFALPADAICGWLVVLQARHDHQDAGAMVISLGADYWSTLTAPWDNYKTNKDVAIGRMRIVGENWKWIGLTTASVSSLKTLQDNGYTLKTNSYLNQ